MITPRHEKIEFFKYYTAEAAKLTLEHCSRKWSTPLCFNDPFDNQFDLHFEDPSEQLAQRLVDQFHQIIDSPAPLRPNQFGHLTPIVEMIRQVRRANPGFQYTKEELAYLREGQIESMNRVIAIDPQANAEIRKVMADTTVFCLSETYDNLLMWSHYAHNHTGAVVKFLSLSEVDSPLVLAERVHYSAEIPRLEFADLFSASILQHQMIKVLTLTKSEVWDYEKEWRVISGLRDKTKEFEILIYAPEEVGAVYLGCKMARRDKDVLVDIVRCKYPKAKLFQAEKHNREFRLVFNEIA